MVLLVLWHILIKIRQITITLQEELINLNLIYSPLDQFEIVNLISLTSPFLGNIRLGLYNISFYLAIAVTLILILNIFSTNYNKIISSL